MLNVNYGELRSIINDKIGDGTYEMRWKFSVLDVMEYVLAIRSTERLFGKHGIFTIDLRYRAREKYK